MNDVQVYAPQEVDSPTGKKSITLQADIIALLLDRAMRYPRDIAEVWDNLVGELGKVPRLAEECYYSIPFDAGSAKESRVEGLTIGAALSIARHLGNCYEGSRYITEDDSHIVVEGFFMDFETGKISTTQIKGSKFYKPKGGNGLVRRTADEIYRLGISIQSKARRNIILHNTPIWIKEQYFDMAKQLILNPPKGSVAATKSIQERISDAKKVFLTTYKVEPAAMEKYIEDNLGSLDSNEKVLVHLKGLFNTFKENPAEVSKVFGKKEEPVRAPVAKSK